MVDKNKFKELIENNLKKNSNSRRNMIHYLLNINNFSSFEDFKNIIITMVEIEQFQTFYNDKILK